MNNDLQQFSEDFLNEMIVGGLSAEPSSREVSALARIALAAKQAKPVAWTSQSNLDAVALEIPNNLEFMSGDKGVYKKPVPLYTTPQPAHTEQDGCQWNPDEDSVYSTGCGNEWQFTDGGLEDNKIKFCPYCSGKIAAPKPESE